MGTITPTQTRISDAGVFDAHIASWALGNADTGVAVTLSDAADRSVQIEGTFGAATITIQGSNDGSNWQSLTDPQGNAIARTTAGLKAITELTRYVRAISSGGTGTAITVTLFMKGQR